MGNDSDPALTVAGAIGAACAVSGKQTATMVVDTGATCVPVSKSWFHDHCEWLGSMAIEIPKIESPEMDFRFGGGSVVRALRKSLITICSHGEWERLDIRVIDAPRPAQLATNSLWRMDVRK